MSYTTADFHETVTNSAIAGQVPPETIDCVLAAWGVDSDGWTGGFLLRLKDGRYAYASGWCDFTGWGCQDGASVSYYDAEPALTGFDSEAPPPEEWDREPADLNRYVRGETDQYDQAAGGRTRA